VKFINATLLNGHLRFFLSLSAFEKQLDELVLQITILVFRYRKKKIRPAPASTPPDHQLTPIPERLLSPDSASQISVRYTVLYYVHYLEL